MSALRTVIVEDEPLAAHRLKLALDGTPDVDLVGTAHDGRQGLELIRKLKPDLVFLDIRMPGLDGLEVAQALSAEESPTIVFVTAFAHFAVEAFEVSALDYVLKPVEFDRVRAAVERARRRREQLSAEQRAIELQGVLNALREEAAESADPAGVMRSLWVSDGRGRSRVQLSSVEWFEAERDYVRIHAGGRTHLMRGTLQGLIGRLDPDVFLRIHRSAVVNLRAVLGVRRRVTGQAVVQLPSGAMPPVGRAYLPELKARLGLNPRAALADVDEGLSAGPR